jgi:hypothetical protein
MFARTVIAVLAVSASAAAVVISDDFTSYNSSLWNQGASVGGWLGGWLSGWLGEGGWVYYVARVTRFLLRVTSDSGRQHDTPGPGFDARPGVWIGTVTRCV